MPDILFFDAIHDIDAGKVGGKGLSLGKTAEAAGVLFTRDPLNASGATMLAEASWGLGEAVVSGRVTPDRFKLERDTGAVREKHLGRKTVRITAAGEEHVPAELQQQFCLG